MKNGESMASKKIQIGDVGTFTEPPESGNPYRGGCLTGPEREASLHAVKDGSQDFDVWYMPAEGGARRITRDEINWEGLRR
jgi:hypothetical protein